MCSARCSPTAVNVMVCVVWLVFAALWTGVLEPLIVDRWALVQVTAVAAIGASMGTWLFLAWRKLGRTHRGKWSLAEWMLLLLPVLCPLAVLGLVAAMEAWRAVQTGLG